MRKKTSYFVLYTFILFYIHLLIKISNPKMDTNVNMRHTFFYSFKMMNKILAVNLSFLKIYKNISIKFPTLPDNLMRGAEPK